LQKQVENFVNEEYATHAGQIVELPTRPKLEVPVVEVIRNSGIMELNFPDT